MVILESLPSRYESIFQLIGVSILFVFILAITVFATRLVGNVKLGQVNKGNFTILETYKLAPNRFLQLIKIGTRYFVLAIGKEEVQLITELQESDVIQKGTSNNSNLNFLDIINKVTKKHSEGSKIKDNSAIQNESELENEVIEIKKIKKDDLEMDHK